MRTNLRSSWLVILVMILSTSVAAQSFLYTRGSEVFLYDLATRSATKMSFSLPGSVDYYDRVYPGPNGTVVFEDWPVGTYLIDTRTGRIGSRFYGYWGAFLADLGRLSFLREASVNHVVGKIDSAVRLSVATVRGMDIDPQGEPHALDVVPDSVAHPPVALPLGRIAFDGVPRGAASNARIGLLLDVKTRNISRLDDCDRPVAFRDRTGELICRDARSGDAILYNLTDRRRGEVIQLRPNDRILTYLPEIDAMVYGSTRFTLFSEGIPTLNIYYFRTKQRNTLLDDVHVVAASPVPSD